MKRHRHQLVRDEGKGKEGEVDAPAATSGDRDGNEKNNPAMCPGKQQRVILVLLMSVALACLVSTWRLYLVVSREDRSGDTGHSECALYLAPSLIPNSGRGVFAGKSFNKYDTIDRVNSVPIPMEELYYQQIFNYVYADEDDYVIAMLGTGMIYNHREPHTVEHFEATRGRSRSHPQTKLLPQSQHYKLDFKTLRPIAAGEELFGNYGEEWFWTRGIEVDDSLDSAIPMLYESLETLREVGHCLSDIQINRSTIAGAGDGVFAQRSFTEGEIVSISPLINIPKRILDRIQNDTVLSNYCFSVPDSEDVFLPIGAAGMINHGQAGGLDLVNLRVEWYLWNNNHPEFDSEEPPIQVNVSSDAGKSPYGLYDFAYIATRNIMAGEELFISYGTEWNAAWSEYISVKRDLKDKRVEEAKRRSSTHADEENTEHKVDDWYSATTSEPLFRHYISL